MVWYRPGSRYVLCILMDRYSQGYRFPSSVNSKGLSRKKTAYISKLDSKRRRLFKPVTHLLSVATPIVGESRLRGRNITNYELIDVCVHTYSFITYVRKFINFIGHQQMILRGNIIYWRPIQFPMAYSARRCFILLKCHVVFSKQGNMNEVYLHTPTPPGLICHFIFLN